MRTEFENIEKALEFFNNLESTEFYIGVFSSVLEVIEDKGFDVLDKDDAQDIKDVKNIKMENDNLTIEEFFTTFPNATIYELSSNGSMEAEFTSSVDDVYYFINSAI